MFFSSRLYRVWIWVCSSFILVLPTLGSAQIVPDTDPNTATQTRVQVNGTGDRHTIDQGIISGDGTNVFHHFNQFDLPTGETAVFDLQNTPAIANILNRVLGDNPSEINGALEILGGNNPNLFLLNPAGIIFGENASLNIPGDFTATTADNLQFSNGTWLPTSTAADYQALNGTPTGLEFLETAGIILNGADLAVADGKAINLVAHSIVNTGTLTATDGSITLTALPETGTVKLSQAGSLINLEFVPNGSSTLTPLDFARLLTGNDLDLDPVEFALGIAVENDLLQLNSGVSLPPTAGLLFSESALNAGVGNVAIAGSQVGIDSNITGKSLNIDADHTFVLLPNGSLNFANGSGAIASKRVGIYGDITANSLTLSAPEGLEITSPFQVDNWSIATQAVEIGTPQNTTTIDVANPFATDLATSYLDTTWLNASLIAGNGGIMSQGGDMMLSSALPTDNIADHQLTLDSAQKLTLNGAIAPSLNQTGKLSLNFHSQDNLTVDQKLQTGGGNITLKSQNNTFINGDIDVGSGQLFFASDINIGDITLGSTNTEIVEFQGQVDGANNLTVTASEINFLDALGENTPLKNISLNTDDLNVGDRLFGTGEFSLSTKTNSTSLTLGSDVEDRRLNLSDLELNRLGDGFSKLTFAAQDIELLNDLNFSDELTLTTTSGNIQANNFELQAPEIRLSSGGNLILGSIETENLTLGATGNIVGANPLAIADLLTIDTDADVILDNINNNFYQIDLVRARNIFIQDRNHVEFIGSNISGNLQTAAASIQASDLLEVSGSLSFTATEFIDTKDLNTVQDILLTANRVQTEALTTSNGSVNISSIQSINIANISAIDLVSLSSQTSTIASGDIGTNTGSINIFAANNISIKNANTGGKIDLKSNFGSIQAENLAAAKNANIFAQNNIRTKNIAAAQVDLKSELGLVQTNNVVARDSSLTLVSEQGLVLDNVTAATNLNLTSLNGAIATKNMLANNNADVTAVGNLNIGNIAAEKVNLESTSGSIKTSNITAKNAALKVTADQNLIADNLTAATDIHLTSKQGAIATNNLTATKGKVKLAADTNVDVGKVTAKGQITVTAKRGDLTTQDITTQGQAIALTAGDEIQSGDLTSKSITTNGGDITVKAIQAIATGNIDSSALAGDAGDIFIDPIRDIQTGYINAESPLGRAGDVEMIAGQHIRLTETFEAASGDEASISTIGGRANGEIKLSHGGGDDQKFQVGDSRINGSAGALVQGDITIPAGSSFEADIDTVDIKEFREEDFPKTLPSANGQQIEGFSVDFFKDITVEDLAITTEDLVNVERQFADAYIEKFNLKEQSSRPSDQVEKTLQTIKTQTNTEPAVVYAFFRPDISTDSQAEEQGEVEWRFRPSGRWRFQDEPQGKASDVLELVMVTADGTKTRKRIRGATRQEVIFQANRFFSHVTNLRLRNAYLYSARELHRILVEPLEAEMAAAGVDNLTYIMDSGLRVLPLAALHDGQQFLVEKYSLGTMPSFELTNTNYVDLNGSSVLAMGSSEFDETLDLPAVPLELRRVRDQVGEGEIFLNEQFTVENLVAARRHYPHNIVHLATHGEFLPGNLENSYIQFWDERLTLRDLSKLELSSPVVNLLVLSACRTALGNQDAELGFAGLAIASGAKSVLGSLWYVSDEGTLGLMTEFYRALKTSPIKAEALRQAQLAMLRGDVTFKKSTYRITRGEIKPLPHIAPELAVVQTQDFSHPYYWSAFNMVGNPW
ncbi:CHAT domain-containing protein [[Limnothrix rosea] IAM M-220]|uniref:CHAT domain-containing protein n=1 Tax=[Limnothrix rosea] IAM M-220 TaxID=454133 RepID=UPI000958FF33|nr:CHAT domain-containing protein [[Limnothrix rosea] IAM M-220]OKH15077.1 hypothetical protein NIES208_13305 [[Limnothrix rosea] IAM M-220]